MVCDGALREPDLAGELRRRRRSLAQEGDDLEPNVVGERAQLLGLGRRRGCRRRRSPEVADSGNGRWLSEDTTAIDRCRANYGTNVPSGPAGAGKGEAPGTLLPGTPFTLRRVRERERRERDRVAVHIERVIVVVRVRVAGQVVARVELGARRAAPDRLLLRRLDLLRAREEAAGGNAVLDERLIVAAAAELRVVVRLARAACRTTRRRPRSRLSRAGSAPAPRTTTRRRRRP